MGRELTVAKQLAEEAGSLSRIGITIASIVDHQRRDDEKESL
jgi:hypothetical protein